MTASDILLFQPKICFKVLGQNILIFNVPDHLKPTRFAWQLICSIHLWNRVQIKQWRVGACVKANYLFCETVACWQGEGGDGPRRPPMAIFWGRNKEKGAPNIESGWASFTNRVLELIGILQFLTTTSSFLVALWTYFVPCTEPKLPADPSFFCFITFTYSNFSKSGLLFCFCVSLGNLKLPNIVSAALPLQWEQTQNCNATV